MVCSVFEKNCLISSSIFHVREKVPSFNFNTGLPQKMQIPIEWEVPGRYARNVEDSDMVLSALSFANIL